MKRTPEGVLMDYQLIRAYCAKDLNGILQPRDKWHSTPESRWDELEHRILLKHRTGARYLEPRQYAAAVCLRALEMLDVPYQADDDYPEFTQADSIEESRVMLANALNDYIPHLSASEAAPLLPVNAELQQFKLSVTPQQTAPATDAATPAPVVAEGASGGVEPDKAGPVAVKTRAMADSFAGLRWSGDEWVTKLGNKTVWLNDCLVLNRARGEGMRQWNPVLIGAYLVRMKHAKANSVRARFQTEDALKPWLDEWKTYEADNFTTD